MKMTVKILVLRSEVEARLLSGLLEQRNIPHMLKSFHDSAYDGVWQTDTSWGALYSYNEYKDDITRIYDEMSLPENLSEDV
ncbi:MAG TPA: hypothetical protein PLV06_11030 [Bacteroidales bacterium]|nr:hypothetical protein [Bacteroidales bacterium]HPF02468.1 hypothetical protein [Bacteroidales bacterium]HPJ59986.1 hypothetical protein [Bacteroidales bacterium]HPR12909.1 hypothetical protein [Bacteroidales bacterium]HRW86660.1 hypothetical protein [Bacteroidales bacterium]